jgi:predicted PurR-regulated permease PerM
VTTTSFRDDDLVQPRPALPYDTASGVIAGVALLLVLPLHLLPALLAGLSVYELVQFLAHPLKIVRIHHTRRRLAAVAIVGTGVVLLLMITALGTISFLDPETGNLSTLLNKIVESIESWRALLPGFVAEQLPPDVGELRGTVVAWLRPHVGELRHAGAEVGRTLAHILFGLGIGVLVALYDAQPHEPLGPFARALQERASRLGEAFRRIVSAQIRISAINTILTALYLLVALPLAGVYVPLAKTMLVITFLVGLLPVVGNLISNTIIVILSLSVSLSVAIVSLVFLVVIHKLEYFLNAHLIGSQVHAHAWELLLAMLVMEAAFGIPGLVAAPIYYAYIKHELVSRKLV